MNELYTSVTLGILIGWVAFKILSFILPNKTALIFGMFIGLMSATLARETQSILYFTAILSPIAITIPLLALRSLLQTFSISCPQFSKWEMAGILAIYIAYLAASLGVLIFDPYRLGYSFVWAGTLAIMLIGYGAVRRNPFFPIAAISGQILWVSDIGSSNYFDHIGHALLVPIILVALIRRY